jgi:ABC-type dipeptide/oligopeptide/nickel transport system permease subunit
MLHDLVPNVISQILIQFTMNVSYMILLGSTLSFLGLGAQPPTPEWGAMLAEGLQDYQFYPYLVMFPGMFLALTALAINIFGDALRDGFDPKLKGRA